MPPVQDESGVVGDGGVSSVDSAVVRAGAWPAGMPVGERGGDIGRTGPRRPFAPSAPVLRVFFFERNLNENPAPKNALATPCCSCLGAGLASARCCSGGGA